MTWLRFLNPLYTIRLERRFREVVSLGHCLAGLSKTVAIDAKALADGDAKALKAGEAALRDAVAERRTMRAALEMIASHMASGKTMQAKQLVDGLITLIDARHL